MNKYYIPSVRLDNRTGQYVPTVNGKDVSPTSFDEARALEIARQIADQDELAAEAETTPGVELNDDVREI